MPVTMGGMASGIDTDAIIDKLVTVEARPIKQWAADKRKSNTKKEALGVLRSHLKELNKSAKTLYGFRATYNNKKVISSDPSIIEASATKRARKGKRKVEVKELASSHKIATDPIDNKKKLPSGKINIEINEVSKKIKFRGGRLEALKQKIDDVASDLLETSLVMAKANNFVLTIESDTPGKKGEIKIGGDKDFLKSIGLINGIKGEKKDRVNVIFKRQFFTTYAGEFESGLQKGSLKVGRKGKSLNIKGVLWKEYVLPIEPVIKEDTVLEFDVNYKIKKEQSEDALPYKMEMGPEEKTIIKGIELKSYNIVRERPVDQKEKKKEITNFFGIGIISSDKGQRNEKLYKLEKDAKGKQIIPVGKDFQDKNVSKLIFYCNSGNVEFSNTKIITPVKGTGTLEPKNVIAKAGDAKLNIDGVDAVRDRNTDLNDIIEGVTMTLRGDSKKPVTLSVEADIESSIEKLQEFVKAYNKYIDFSKNITKAFKTKEAGEFKKLQQQSGLFVGDMTILRLESYLKRAVSESYPNRADNPIKILPQIGISTGDINSEWDTISDGKLVIDDGKLKNSILENPESVNEFFGSDTDGDNRVDNGLAYRIGYLLKPYVMSGNSIITTKIKLEDTSIKSFNDKIDRHKEHLKKYEDKLRRKFIAMEKAISGANAQRAWMQNQMPGSQGSGKKGGK